MRLTAIRFAAGVNAQLRVRYLSKARQDAPRPRTVARKQLRRTVQPIADDLARQTHAQVAQSLGVATREIPFELDEQAYGFVDGMVSLLEEYPIEATRRAAQAFDEWATIEEEDRTVEALGTMLDVAFDGAESGLQNSLRLLFGDTFAQMNKAAQLSAGVEGYYWLSRRDPRVRPEHEEVDNADTDGPPYSWDEPPLSAAKSSNEEDCHPGEDYGCRCLAVPAAPVDSNVSESER
jgi:hypothetical protein